MQDAAATLLLAIAKVFKSNPHVLCYGVSDLMNLFPLQAELLEQEKKASTSPMPRNHPHPQTSNISSNEGLGPRYSLFRHLLHHLDQTQRVGKRFYRMQLSHCTPHMSMGMNVYVVVMISATAMVVVYARGVPWLRMYPVCWSVY